MTHTVTMTDSFSPSKLALALAAVVAVAGCANDRPLRTPDVQAAVRADMAPAKLAEPKAEPKPTAVPMQVTNALAEPATPLAPLPAEPRLDLLVNDANAREVFLAIVADTRYSMLMHPDVGGKLSVTLRGVTVQEALESIRDVYGYDFKIDGRRITVYAPTLQTRIFTLNYPTSQRAGSSELRVSSGAGQSSSQGSTNTGNTNTNNNSNNTGGQGGTNGGQTESSRISTSSKSEFWVELAEAVRGLVGKGEGRSVITSPQAGIMAVRGMPDELRQVEKFLKAAQIAVERQVMLEAKIVEVELRDGFQSGIDWSALRNGKGQTGAMGTMSGNTTSNALVRGVQNNLPGFAATAGLLADNIALPASGSGLFGLAFATDGFQAVLGFLETRGDVQILSSPRIATLNNQKAVLKVGTDEYFVTGVSGGNSATQTTTGNTQPTMPSITMSSFFSGISLDVTPQIDDNKTITLHVHPSVSNVTEKTKQIDLGSIGNYRFPMASNSVNESDTVVRIQDGHIVAIGGLMQIETSRQASGLPGTNSVPVFSTLFNNKADSGRKKEVVVLIKPTIIRSSAEWEQQSMRSRGAVDDMDATRARLIQLDGSAAQQSGNTGATGTPK
jgi:MSHA biogenesis protein MshL